MEKNGVETTKTIVHLMLAAERSASNSSLLVVIGTPSRGVVSNIDRRLQHLAVWEIEGADVQRLKNAALACDVLSLFKGNETPDELRELIDSVFAELLNWQNQSKVRWCSVLENRPEIIVRRDEGAPTDWFCSKSVAIWGCGALGGLLAEHLVRSGANRIDLYDNKIAGPGVLVRQNFVEADVSDGKAAALGRRLQAISPSTAVSVHARDVLQHLDDPEWEGDVDFVIDATASLRVRTKLESVLKSNGQRVPIAVVMVSGTVQHAAVVLVPPNYSGGPLDALRRLGLAAMNRAWLKDWVQAFWQERTTEPTRQPEPGCSDPTFVGSHVDVASLAARMLNQLAGELSEIETNAVGALLAQDVSKKRDHIFRFPPDIVVNGDEHQFRLSMNAWRDLKGWLRTNERSRDSTVETGGLMFGQFDEVLGIGWITAVSGPLEGSEHSATGFICGVGGIAELCDAHTVLSNGVSRYIGTWHSHPVSPAIPSATDYAGIGSIFAASPEGGTHQLMMIVGNISTPELGVYSFVKRSFVIENGHLSIQIEPSGGRCPVPEVAKYGGSIGLALSGGGSRAVAFHLGTLRALEDLGLLDEVDVVSGVSGGSVMTGILGYTNESFSRVDSRTFEFLRRGLVRPSLWKLVHPRRLASSCAAFLLAALPSMAATVVRTGFGLIATLAPDDSQFSKWIQRLDWPIRRWYSRTHIIADALEDVVGRQRCSANTRQQKSIVFNACELRTGTAFRMSNRRAGSWRFGWISADDIRVADAVAASAAYPALLPPFDWVRRFEKNGTTRSERVIVTDGGVFENLGVSVMEPGRDSDISAITYAPNVIIASDAGAGQFSGAGFPQRWGSRMVQVVSSVMRKVQDATKQRLHEHAADGRLDGFIYAQLGQIDERVPLKPATWVNRSEVVEYPTNFSAMTERNIEALANRGEALTRALITQYLLSD